MSNTVNRKTVIKGSLLLVTVFFFFFSAFSQKTDPLEKKLTIVDEQISVIDLLNHIEKNSSVYFSYSPDSFQGEFLEVNFIERKISYILNLVLKPDYTFVVNGREIIIFKNRDHEEKEEAEKSEESPHAETATAEESKEDHQAQNFRIKYDTVFVTTHDTIIQTDTVSIRDTIIVRDTVYLKRAVKKPYRDGAIFRNTTLSDIQNKKYYFEIFAGPVFETNSFTGENSELVNLYEAAYENIPSIEAGVTAGRHLGAFLLEAGLGLRQVREDFSYTYTMPSDSYFEVDTVDSYYTINNQDTTWYYVTDSTLQTVPGKEENYSNRNYYTYLNIPITVGYKFTVRNVITHIKMGIVSDVLIGSGGYYIDDSEHNPVEDYEKLNLSPYMLSGRISLGAVYYINHFSAVSIGLNYRRAFNPLFEDEIPVSRENSSLSGTVGFRILF